jgi:hypothetical protein
MQARPHLVTARIKRPRSLSIAYCVGIALKYVVLAIAACALWKFIGDGPGKAKYHGAVIGVLVAYLVIQEGFFQLSRSKINEAVNSPAVDIPDLEFLHARIARVKAHLDMLWKITVPAKFASSICGITLFMGGNPVPVFRIRSMVVTWDDITASAGWFLILVGIDLTWRTFSLFRHVDAFNTKLSVKAKELAAQKEAADKLKAADPGADWPEDPTPSGYPRLRTKNS